MPSVGADFLLETSAHIAFGGQGRRVVKVRSSVKCPPMDRTLPHMAQLTNQKWQVPAGDVAQW